MTQSNISSELSVLQFLNQESSLPQTDGTTPFITTETSDFNTLITNLLIDTQTELNSALDSQTELKSVSDLVAIPIEKTNEVQNGNLLPYLPTNGVHAEANPLNLSGNTPDSEILQDVEKPLESKLIVELPSDPNTNNEGIDEDTIPAPTLKADYAVFPHSGIKKELKPLEVDRQNKRTSVINTTNLNIGVKVDPDTEQKLTNQPIKTTGLQENFTSTQSYNREQLVMQLEQKNFPETKILDKALLKSGSNPEISKANSSISIENSIQLLHSPPKFMLTPTSRLETQLPMPMSDQSNWQNALSDRIVWFVRNNIQQAEIKLNPPHLGHMEVKISMQNDQTSILISTHNSLVRDLVENTIPRLREMFNEQGLNLSDVNVSDKSLPQQEREYRQSFNSNSQQQNQSQENTEKEKHDPATHTSVHMVDYYA